VTRDASLPIVAFQTATRLVKTPVAHDEPLFQRLSDSVGRTPDSLCLWERGTVTL